MDSARLALAEREDLLRPRAVPNPLGFGVLVVRLAELRVAPAPLVAAGRDAELRVQLEIVARFEVADFLLALDEDRESRRLHAAHGRDLETAEQLLVKGGHRARPVDADEPIAFRTAGGGLGERDHFLVAAQVGEALADGVGGHGLQPEPPDGLAVFEMARDVAENQLAFASGVAGVDDFGDVRAGEEFFEHAELVLGFLAGHEIEVVGEDREVLEAPFAADDAEFFRLLDFEQVADRVRDDHVRAFVVTFLPLELAEGSREVAGDAGFFRDDECFGHLQTSLTKRLPGSCLTSRRISRPSNVEDTAAAVNPLVAITSSSAVSDAPRAS